MRTHQRINKIYYLAVSREKPLHCSSIYSIRENDISMKIMSVYVNKKTKDKKYIFSKQSVIMN